MNDMACMMFDCKYLYDFKHDCYCVNKGLWIRDESAMICRDCTLAHGCEYCIYRNSKCKDLED